MPLPFLYRLPLTSLYRKHKILLNKHVNGAKDKHFSTTCPLKLSPIKTPKKRSRKSRSAISFPLSPWSETSRSHHRDYLGANKGVYCLCLCPVGPAVHQELHNLISPTHPFDSLHFLRPRPLHQSFTLPEKWPLPISHQRGEFVLWRRAEKEGLAYR